MIEPGQVLKTIEELREAIKLQSQGIRFQTCCPKLGMGWTDDNFITFTSPIDCDYRRAPEPQTVPLGPEDVPPGSAIRCNSITTWILIVATSDSDVRTYGGDRLNWQELMRDWLIKRPGEDWQPCHKVSTVE